MYVNFMDMNKACSKDSYYLSWINQLVDNTVGHGMLSFWDTFSRYHRISMDPIEAEKAFFITDQGTVCYRAMPFGLKNIGVTY